jgi:hypothetical protein
MIEKDEKAKLARTPEGKAALKKEREELRKKE